MGIKSFIHPGSHGKWKVWVSSPEAHLLPHLGIFGSARFSTQRVLEKACEIHR